MIAIPYTVYLYVCVKMCCLGLARARIRTHLKKTIHLCSRQAKWFTHQPIFYWLQQIDWTIGLKFVFVYSQADVHYCCCVCVFISIASLTLHLYNIYLEFFIRALKTLLERARDSASKQTHKTNGTFLLHWNYNNLCVRWCVCVCVWFF